MEVLAGRAHLLGLCLGLLELQREEEERQQGGRRLGSSGGRMPLLREGGQSGIGKGELTWYVQ